MGHAISDKWLIDVTAYFSRSEQDGFNQEEGGAGFFRLTRTPAAVDITQRDAFGRLWIRTNLAAAGVQNENPLYNFENVEREDIRYRFLGGATVKYTPLDWLDADANFSIDRLNLNFRQFQNLGFRTTNSVPATNNGLIFNGVNNTQSINAERAGDGAAPAVLVAPEPFQRALGFRGTGLRWSQLAGTVPASLRRPGGGKRHVASNDRIIGEPHEANEFLRRGVLRFFDRYTVDLAVRQDGSSRFGADNQMANVRPRVRCLVGFQRNWWPSDQVSAFTLRASLGTAGKSPPFVAQYETYNIAAGGVLNAQNLGNPDLRPEVVTEFEAGTDIELFNRFGLTVTYAQSVSDDQILQPPISVSSGFQRQWQNVGSLENKSWEAALTIPICSVGICRGPPAPRTRRTAP